jgi:uncharacterized protein (TIGR02145 family)
MQIIVIIIIVIIAILSAIICIHFMFKKLRNELRKDIEDEKNELGQYFNNEITKFETSFEKKISDQLEKLVASNARNAELESISFYFCDQRDGQVYRAVKIGSLIWMAQNLNYAGENNEFGKDNSANYRKYGRLYTWEDTTKNICPDGWRLPDRNEWEELKNAVGGHSVAAERLKAKSGWNGDNGTDHYGFSALPCGFDNPDKGNYTGIGYGMWWSSMETNDNKAAYCYQISNDMRPYSASKSNLLSVRCVKNKA